MMRAFTSAVCLLALAACEDSRPGVYSPQSSADEALALQCEGDAEAAETLSASINLARDLEGKNILVPVEKLDLIAKTHACDMVRMNMAIVAGSNGSNVVDRARAVDYPTCGVVQLVGVGGTPEATVATWLNATPLREQVLGQLSYEIGTGVVRGPDGRLWHSAVLGNDCA
nr:CAP domain-containing protein [Paracoccus saliphilus]